ncbi:MAG: glycosyltransferase [Bryobacterales bacterium]|nr:glycosyltransferase [Bryobacteraceae bacterium]MDW8354837.1 glycosyltransferase [Bryobacterales bacterium]
MRRLLRLLGGLPLAVVSPVLVLVTGISLALCDLAWLLFGRRRAPANRKPSTAAVSIVIPTWNGRELLAKHLPSVIAAAGVNPDNEILVVDNASTDGTAEFLAAAFPQVRVVPLARNEGFGGASNAGVRAARHDIVVLLNNDMRVAPDFLAPLLEGFTDEQVFSVSCQIFFSDPDKRREETGLTQIWWQDGMLRVRHRRDDAVNRLFPCAYGGGGSCAFDRGKFLELGGFDPLFRPFYLEDNDLGYLAWKRGWKVLYQPASVVWHEHRGTIGRRFTAAQIEAVLAKNFLLWCWKNIHDWRRLVAHLALAWCGALVSWLAGESPERPTLAAWRRAAGQLPQALRSRWRARSLAVISDAEAFRRPLGGYFRDRFLAPKELPARPRVLFVSPYPIYPPTHGGAVFMFETLRELARYCELHLIAWLDREEERAAHAALRQWCATLELPVKENHAPPRAASLLPHAVREFASADFEWLIHRQTLLEEIDIVQLEYTPLAQYAGEFQRLATALFEHDIYFQSVARGWRRQRGVSAQLKALLEYLRALHYETRALPRLDAVQTCTAGNADFLVSFAPSLRGKAAAGLRACVDTSRYCFRPQGREPGTMLFVGSFRHLPNQAGLSWFLEQVLPLVTRARPEARLVVAGSDPPPVYIFPDPDHVELLGCVPDVREPLGRYAVFVCPVLFGSGVRVKLLEAFAAGIPVVSTRLGAEGLAERDGELCALADDAETFARKILALFDDPEAAARMAERARAEVEANWDARRVTERLAQSYRELLRAKRV